MAMVITLYLMMVAQNKVAVVFANGSDVGRDIDCSSWLDSSAKIYGSRSGTCQDGGNVNING